MDVIIKIIGTLLVCVGVIFIIKPEFAKKIMEFLEQGRRIYITGVIRLILGILFLLAARECKITWLITTIGIVFLTAGVLIFVIKTDKIKSILKWYQNKPLPFIRLMCMFPVVLGGIIIYAA